MARAEALKARTFYQPVGPGELEIPAIRGVGGSLLYFLEEAGKNWDLDFEPLRSDAMADRLDAVDHISQSMPYDEMLSWLLFYTGILDLERLATVGDCGPGWPRAKPCADQWRSKPALSSTVDTRHRTPSARFIHEFFGSGVPHAAFSCRDIFAAIADTCKRGADF
jgi:4-hydroxyphenylpyruvate dioxygenase